MPGSLLNLQDIHSDHSDASFRSSDSRASGKKVSFNNAVRVKQYPWHPEDSRGNYSSPLLSNQRFWFKVYKSSPSPPQQNAWKKNESSYRPQAEAENAHDSLTPIAEDEDVNDETYAYEPEPRYDPSAIKHNQGILQHNGNPYSPQPEDPPVDYMDDDGALWRAAQIPQHSTDYAKFDHDRERNGSNTVHLNFGNKRNSENQQPKTEVNRLTSPVRSSGFRRPTISSAAKCASERPVKEPVASVKLPRAVAKEPASARRKEPTSSTNQKPRERRSRSNDDDLNTERRLERMKRVDKAVSTEDLSTDSKEIEENDKGNGLWWSQKKGKDKATQCSGTLTYGRRGNVTPSGVLKPTRPATSSTFTQSEFRNPSSFHSVSPKVAEHKPLVTKRERDTNGHSLSSNPDSNELSLHGKSCISGSKHTVAHKDENLAREDPNFWLPYADENNSKLSNYNSDRFEYDYVTDAMPSGNCSSPQFKEKSFDEQRFPRGLKDSNTKQSSWKTMLDGSIRDRSAAFRSEEKSGKQKDSGDVSKFSTIGLVRGKRIPFSNQQQQVSTAVSKNTCRGNNEIRGNLTYTSDSEAYHNRYPKVFNSGSPLLKGKRYGSEDLESPIDWSTSGFTLGARSDYNLSSSSDSECIVHRRPPLLMYIPGVSHHNRPAAEDDRLSALSEMSRSEVEEDSGLLSVRSRSEFKRRYSMPRNGKLNWLKWKSNKSKLLKQI